MVEVREENERSNRVYGLRHQAGKRNITFFSLNSKIYIKDHIRT